MSESERQNDGKPEPFFYSRDDGSQEDVRSPEANAANSAEEIQAQAQAQDEEWKEADLHVSEPESDGDPDETAQRRNRRKNRPRSASTGSRPDPRTKRRRKIRQQRENTSGLERDRLSNIIEQEFVEVRVSRATLHLMEQFLEETSDAVTNESDCNFLTQAWDFEENKRGNNEKCIQAIKRDPDLDAKYYGELIKKKEHPMYIEMCACREKLPAYKMKDQIVHLIEDNQVCFISGGTGCGKTTQVVQFVLDDWIMNMNGSVCNIVCTQPRRVSACSIAERIAAERLEPPSVSVGYQIRFENKIAERKVCCINFVTTGVLLQWLVTNPLLPHVSHVFLDEVHEKTIEFTVVMALLKTIIQERRDLKVILMSATTDSDLFCNYFDGAPALDIPGYTFPVEDFYLDEIINLTNYKVPEKEIITNYDTEFEDFDEDIPYVPNPIHCSSFQVSEKLDIPLIAHVVGYICTNEEDGAILVFLTGLRDILMLKRRIEDSPWYSSEKYFIVTTHSLLPEEAQKDVFAITPKGKRKIVLATSIMETSVTLADISYVVDSGKIKFCKFNANLKISTLNPTWISVANAKQRRGRVGRTKPGKCYKLYTKEQESSFIPYPPMDVQLIALEHVILEAKLMKIKQVAPFLEKTMDPPHPGLVELALKELRKMSALTNEEEITPLGYHLSRLPMDVRTGKMILMGAFFSCIDPIFSIAACLNYKDPFDISLDEDEIMTVKRKYSIWKISDHLIFSDILTEWENKSPSDRSEFCSEKFMSESNLNEISYVKQQIAQVLYTMNFLPSADVKDPVSNVNSENTELIKAILCAGLYPSVATLTTKTRNMGVKTIEEQFAQFHGKSVLSDMAKYDLPFFVYFTIKQSSTKVFVRDASMVEVFSLLLFGKDFEINEIGGFNFVRVDDKLKFQMEERCANLMKRIKTRLDDILGIALLKSQGFNWSQEGKEIKALRGIVDLIKNNRILHKIHNQF